MAEIDHLNRGSEWIVLSFLEREQTPHQDSDVGIQLHLSGLFSRTKRELKTVGVNRSRTAIHNWVQKAELQPVSAVESNHTALDETVIRINDQRHWLYAAVDPAINEFLPSGCFTRTTPRTIGVLRGLRKKYDLDHTSFFVDDAPSQSGTHSARTPISRGVTRGIRTQLNVSSAR